MGAPGPDGVARGAGSGDGHAGVPPVLTAEGAARVVLAALEQLVDRVQAELGEVARELDGTELELPIHLVIGGTRDPARAAGLVRDLLSGVRARVDETARGAHAFREGFVYAFHPTQEEAPYAGPPGAADVFAGYSPSGKPEWIGFQNLCLAMKEERVDRLYAEPPEIVALVQGPAELTGGLLPGFGRESLVYKLWGQVVVGLVPRNLQPKARGVERVALTLQVVGTREGSGGERLRLNVLGLTQDAISEAAASSDPSSPAEAFRRLLRATRGRIDAIGRRLARARGEARERELGVQVGALLVRLRADVLRVFKVRDYRTQHAEARHSEGDRPTASALTDLIGAGDGHFFRDDHKNTVIAVGPRGRVHVFSPEGKHVTSLEMQPGEVERRVDRGRWRPLERAAQEAFKAEVARARVRV